MLNLFAVSTPDSLLFRTMNVSMAILCIADMLNYMGKLTWLDQEQRNMLSVAVKNVIGARRASWRIISSIEQKEEAKGASQSTLESLREYRAEVRFV